ncbi:MAG: hypothetical protein ABEN55_12040 [Bradymonadaceae bacterium]
MPSTTTAGPETDPESSESSADGSDLYPCPDDLPDDIRCLTPKVDYAISAEALNKREKDLSKCRKALDKTERQRDRAESSSGDCKRQKQRLRTENRKLVGENAVLRQRPTKLRAAVQGIAAALIAFAGGYFTAKLTD